MNAGKRNKRIELQRVTGQTRNEVNESTDVWTTYATWWAGINPVSGDETLRGKVPEGTVTHEITILGTYPADPFRFAKTKSNSR